MGIGHSPVPQVIADYRLNLFFESPPISLMDTYFMVMSFVTGNMTIATFFYKDCFMASWTDRKTIRKILAAAAFIVLVAVIASFVTSRLKKPSAKKPDSTVINPEATLSASSIKHESIKNGFRQWSMEADRVDYFEAGKIAEFTGARASFFTNEGREAGLSAEKCRISAETGAVEAEGNVTVKYYDHTITTARLNYQGKEHIIESMEKVRIAGSRLNLTAESFRIDLNGNELTCTGDVKGSINDLYFN